MICQFCGKQVDDNAVICRYCGSRLVNNIKPKGGSSVDDSDMTVVMPRAKSSSSARGFESSRAVRDNSRNTESRRIPEENAARNREKRQYYRYNPDAKHMPQRQKQQPQNRDDRKTAPRYNGGMPRQPKKHGVGKWVFKTLGIAVIGIVIGMLIYLGTVGVSNWFKSVGNHNNVPSVSAPSENKSDSKSKSGKDAEKNNSSQTSESKPNDTESDGSVKSSSDKSSSTSESSSSKDKNSSSGSSVSDTNKSNKRDDTEIKEDNESSEASSNDGDSSESAESDGSSESGGNDSSASEELED